ncbi:hypothetical protein [Sediminibacterium soli]|uniref:hypothetical protein n=1 Tax=Sediminibacterium soli TaxID=2698829 RepID=UPI001379D313|nr:hypothetical protein [Sediminibacterium soli]NCI47587.1 hypothetical protein [Sediminibacterium soli]
MFLKRISKWVMIAGVLLIWGVKFIIRPFVYIPVSVKPIVGIAPNLIGSFLLPFGACLFFQRIFRLQSQRDLGLTCLIGLLLVVLNEYLQKIPVFGRTFDYLDIFSSVIGVCIGHWVFGRLMRSREALIG